MDGQKLLPHLPVLRQALDELEHNLRAAIPLSRDRKEMDGKVAELESVLAAQAAVTELLPVPGWEFAHAPEPEPPVPDPPEGWEDDDDRPHYDTPGGW